MKLIDVKPRIDFVEAVHGVGEVLVCHVGLARQLGKVHSLVLVARDVLDDALVGVDLALYFGQQVAEVAGQLLVLVADVTPVEDDLVPH